MAVQGRALQRFNRVAANPPLVVRWAAVPIAAFLTVAMTERRGWPYGLAAAVYGGVFLSMALRPSARSTGPAPIPSPTPPSSARSHS